MFSMAPQDGHLTDEYLSLSFLSRVLALHVSCPCAPVWLCV